MARSERIFKKIFVYGIRNSFGMAVDPISGSIWFQENGEDAFDELNRAEPGMNGGWIQIMGPLNRIAEYRQIETTSLHAEDFPNLQQFRWGPERIANSPEEAVGRLFLLPGAHYSDPEFSWKYVLAPAIRKSIIWEFVSWRGNPNLVAHSNGESQASTRSLQNCTV